MVIKIDKEPIPITEIEQSAFCQTDKELASKTLEQEFNSGVRWQKLPVSYMRTSPEELEQKIYSAKKKLGNKIVILGHHYQRDEVIQFADVRGDSFKLAQHAAKLKAAAAKKGKK